MITYDPELKRQNELLKSLIKEVLDAPGLGASHRHFSRYFYISLELGKRLKEAIEKE